MKSYVLLATALVVATLSGCASVGGARAVATPWGAAGLYSFKDKDAVAGEPREHRADVQVAKALDSYQQQQQSSGEDVRVASAASESAKPGT